MDTQFDNPNKRIPTDASIDEIARSVNQTLREIEIRGETPELYSELYFKYGRLKFCEGKYEEAQAIFGQCNSITMNNGLPENYEIYYWIARIKEANGDFGNAKMIYKIALKRCKDYPGYISRSEILETMNKTA